MAGYSFIGALYTDTYIPNTANGYQSLNSFYHNPNSATRIVIMEKHKPITWNIVSGGYGSVNSLYTTITNGINNVALGNYSWVGGGINNVASSHSMTILV